MTTLNNDELRAGAIRIIKAITSKDAREPLAYVDDIMQLIATHDQQLLEAILEGQREYYSPALRVDAVPVEHIKSVFGGSK